MTAQTLTPAMAASQASWRCVQSHDRAGWLALMAPDVVIEDPIGKTVTNPDGLGVRGKDAVAAFYDTNIGPNKLAVTCEETFPSSSPNEVAHILVLRSEFDGGFTSTVRGGIETAPTLSLATTEKALSALAPVPLAFATGVQ